MKHRALCLWIALSPLLCSPALAAGDKVAATSNAASPKRASQENREAKRVSLLGDVTATYVPVLAPGIGVRAALFLDEATLLEGGYTRSAAVEFFGNDQLNLYMNYVFIHLKKFLGNSFFLDAGLATKQTAAKQEGLYHATSATASGGAGTAKDQIEETVTTRGVEAVLGNRWQWGHVTLGGDWLGVYLPSASSTAVKAASDTIPAAKRRELEDRVRDRTAKTAELFIRFGLGASF